MAGVPVSAEPTVENPTAPAGVGIRLPDESTAAAVTR